MKLVIETKQNKDGSFLAEIMVEGIGKEPMKTKTKEKASEKEAFEAALYRLKHIYL